MKQTYKTKNFSEPTLYLIRQANEIIEELMADGYTLTLRQLYYQFVSRDLFENVQRNYKRLSIVMSDARLAGMVDWDAIVDRTRYLERLSHWDSVGSILYSCVQWYHRDLWETQPYRVEVWIEKQALIGIVERPCEELDVPFFACRGYVSQSEQRKAGERAIRNFNDYDQETIILHLGDHDPSGVDMTRDNSDRLDMFSGSGLITVERIALTPAQIEEYDPPPNPAKLSDSRAGGYIQEHGYNSWELDALSPRVIDALIHEHVNKYIDEEAMEEAKERQENERQVLRDLADQY